MGFLCALGLHRWHSKATARPGVAVHRCALCGTYVLTRNHRGRRQKRWWAIGVLGFCLLAWFASINLVRTGHTRVLHTAGKVGRDSGKAYQTLREKVRKEVGAPDKH